MPLLNRIDWKYEIWNAILDSLHASARIKIGKILDLTAPPPFVDYVVGVLRADAKAGATRRLSSVLLEANVLVHAVSTPNFLPLSDAIRISRAALRVEPEFHEAILEYLIRPPRKGPENTPEDEIVHAFRVIDAISERDQLVTPMKFLKASQKHVRAVRLMARANRSAEWAEQVLASPNPRIRANLVEGLAEQTGDHVVPLLRAAANDKHHRVATTARLALCSKGDLASYVVLRQLAKSGGEEFRKSAAWALAQLGGIALDRT